MILSVICIICIGILLTDKNFFGNARTLFTTFSVSILTLIRYIKILIWCITNFNFAREIFIIKLRNYLSNKFEIGLITRYRGNYYDLTYFDGMNRYIVRFPKVRGGCPFVKVTTQKDDAKEIDVTHSIVSFAGPSSNFHGIQICPKFLGYESLTFTLKDGEVKTFLCNDNIMF